MLTQSQTQKQGLRIAPSHIQMLNLLHLSINELVQQIQKEIEENPALEEGSESSDEVEDNIDDDYDNELMAEEGQLQEELYDWDSLMAEDASSYKTQTHNDPDQEVYSCPVIQTRSFREELKEQVHLLSIEERERKIADFVLDSIDDDGYLRYSAEDLADDISFSLNIFITTEEVIAVMGIIQQLDPPGIGARDLQECLLLQLKHLEESPYVLLASCMIEEHMSSIETGNYDRIVRSLGISQEQMQEVLKLLASLQPKPVYGHTSSTAVNEYIIPDFILQYDNGSIQVILNTKNAPELRLSSNMLDIAQG